MGYLAVSVVLAALGGALVRWLMPRRRARRLLARAEEKLLGAVVEGDHVRVRGVARRAEPTLVGRFSGRKCIGYRASVEENNGGDWLEIFRMERCGSFVLVAEGVEARVEGAFLLGLEIDHRVDGELPREAVDLLASYGVSQTDPSGRPRRLRYLEATLEDGDSIWVLGRARVVVDPRGQRESFRAQPVLRVFEGTKGDEVILADVEPPQQHTANGGTA
jgi:hypothetical protein